MASRRAQEALANILPLLFHSNNGNSKFDFAGGYLNMADFIETHLDRVGFKLISQQTYDRMREEASRAYEKGNTEIRHRSADAAEGWSKVA